MTFIRSDGSGGLQGDGLEATMTFIRSDRSGDLKERADATMTIGRSDSAGDTTHRRGAAGSVTTTKIGELSVVDASRRTSTTTAARTTSVNTQRHHAINRSNGASR